MNQNIWGKCAWVFIHSIAINYPKDPTPTEKENIIAFFHSLGDILPCRHCRKHYKDNLKKVPIQAGSKMELLYWTIDIHNEVNKTTRKPVLSREEALQRILSMYKKYPNNPEGYQLLYIGILCILAYVVYKYIRFHKIQLYA